MATLLPTRYRIGGMDCASCASKIETAVRRIDGVRDVAVSVTAGTMTVEHGGATDLGRIEKQVSDLGYAVALLPVKSVAKTETATSPHHDRDDHNGTETEGRHGHEHGPTTGPWWLSQKGLLTIASGSALIAAYIVGKLAPSVAPYAFVAAMLIGLVPIARRAIMAARAGTPFSIEMLMTIAAVGALFINASEEAAAVVFLFLIGELLEGVAAGKARASIQSLTALVPTTALLDDNGHTREVPAETLNVGAIILVRPGDRIAADGVIISGESAIDEAPVTGESTPTFKGVDANVFAGTVNSDGALRVRVTAAAADNTLPALSNWLRRPRRAKHRPNASSISSRAGIRPVLSS